MPGLERDRRPREVYEDRWVVDVTDLSLGQIGLVRVRWRVPPSAVIRYGECGSHQVLLAWSVADQRARAELHRQATLDGLATAAAAGRRGGRPPVLTPAEVRLIRRARGQHPPVAVAQLARAFGTARSTVYRALRRAGA